MQMIILLLVKCRWGRFLMFICILILQVKLNTYNLLAYNKHIVEWLYQCFGCLCWVMHMTVLPLVKCRWDYFSCSSAFSYNIYKLIVSTLFYILNILLNVYIYVLFIHVDLCRQYYWFWQNADEIVFHVHMHFDITHENIYLTCKHKTNIFWIAVCFGCLCWVMHMTV